MPQKTKGNARQMLQRTLSRFKQVTGQRIGVVFTWEGGLSILANRPFTDFINDNKDGIWKCLANCPDTLESIPAHDLEMAAKIVEVVINFSRIFNKLSSWMFIQSINFPQNSC